VSDIIVYNINRIYICGNRFAGGRSRQNAFDDGMEDHHYPARPVDKEKAEQELVINIKKATSPDETAPKQKHVRSMSIPHLSPAHADGT
jgi:hypothetical protein